MILWRRVLFVLVVLGAQGAMGAVLPVFVSPPDLFLLTALAPKWLIFIALGYWTRLDAMNLETLLYRFVPEVITTLILGPLFFAFFNWAFGKSRSNEDRLF